MRLAGAVIKKKGGGGIFMQTAKDLWNVLAKDVVGAEG